MIALEKSLSRKGVPFYFSMESGEWTWKRKVEWELEQAQAHPDDHFVFIDAWDFLFVGEKAELEDILYSSKGITFSCDAGSAPWPQRSLAAEFDKRRKKLSPWCYLNGSGPAGKGSDIAEAARWGLNRTMFREPPETDQTFWTMVYLAGGFGTLDQYCYLTQALYDSSQKDNNYVTPHLAHKNGRLVNMLTLSRPQFIHASGHSWAAIPKELLPK